MKWAYLAHPNPYGLFSVFRNLRMGLARHSIELRWIGIGPKGAEASVDSRHADERHLGEVVGPGLTDEAALGSVLVRHIESAGYDGVVVNPPQGAIEMNVPRYLRRDVLRIAIVHHIVPGAIRPARAIREHT